jgi:hypothetical protein
MDSPAMVSSALTGEVRDVSFKDVVVNGRPAMDKAGIPLILSDQASEPEFDPGSVDASFSYQAGALRPRMPIHFRASYREGFKYQRSFGDGAIANGAEVQHAFPDAQGTLLDGSGRRRVLLHVTEAKGGESWSCRSVVIANGAKPPLASGQPLSPEWSISKLPGGKKQYDGYIDVPADGGHTFTFLTSTTAQMTIDGNSIVRNPEMQPQVCGSIGNAVQPLRLSLVLQRGLHRFSIVKGADPENAIATPRDSPLLLWEGPEQRSEQVPEAAIRH